MAELKRVTKFSIINSDLFLDWPFLPVDKSSLIYAESYRKWCMHECTIRAKCTHTRSPQSRKQIEYNSTIIFINLSLSPVVFVCKFYGTAPGKNRPISTDPPPPHNSSINTKICDQSPISWLIFRFRSLHLDWKYFFLHGCTPPPPLLILPQFIFQIVCSQLRYG